jgi:hypothetical protein
MSHHGAVWRKKVPPIKGKRRFREDIKKIHFLVESGELINRIEKVVGSLERAGWDKSFDFLLSL